MLHLMRDWGSVLSQLLLFRQNAWPNKKINAMQIAMQSENLTPASSKQGLDSSSPSFPHEDTLGLYLLVKTPAFDSAGPSWSGLLIPWPFQSIFDHFVHCRLLKIPLNKKMVHNYRGNLWVRNYYSIIGHHFLLSREYLTNAENMYSGLSSQRSNPPWEEIGLSLEA